MSITNYSELKTAVADWLNRSDLTAIVPDFIALAEAEFKRDERCRKLQNLGTFTVSADDQSLPTDFQALEDWYHDGDTYYGSIEIVGAEQLSTLRARYGLTGAPRWAAIIDGTVRYAPTPDGSYSTKMTYWRSIVSLSASNTTNWLLTAHPDVYLYGSLLQASPYLKDDDRVPVWSGLLEKGLNSISRATWNAQWSGTMKRRINAIG